MAKGGSAFGADRLTGGGGANVFTHYHLSDSKLARGGRDTITDFNGAQGDRIDVASLAQAGREGQEQFTFIGKANFTGIAGQIRDYQSGGDTFIQLDNTGAGKADFEIALLGKVALASTDFITVFTPP
jgi:Ca2+-binding RTX toxin-like protein